MSIRHRPRLRFSLWLLLGVLLSSLWFLPVAHPSTPAQTSVPDAFAAGRTAYEQEDYATAIDQWESLLEQTPVPAQRVALLNNLSLAYQSLRDWDAAQAKIEASLILQGYDPTTQQLTQPLTAPLHLAQSLDTYGQWHYLKGNTDAAISLWQQAEPYYTPTQNTHFQPWFENQLNQARALQYLGYHLDAQQLLLSVYDNLTDASSLSANTHVDLAISLGRILRLVGQLESTDDDEQLSAVGVLQRALETWAPQASRDRRSALHLELGNTQRVLTQQARRLNETPISGLLPNATTDDKITNLTANTLTHYQQAAAIADTPLQTTAAQLNELSFRTQIDSNDSEIPPLAEALQTTVNNLPHNLPGLKAKLAFVQNAITLSQHHSALAPSRLFLAEFLKAAIIEATTLNSPQLQAASWELLGHLYEALGKTSTHLDEALTATNEALALTLKAQQPELDYRLQWQLGRILKRQEKVEAAIAAYTASVQTIQSLRRDLVILNPDVQFSFRDAIEPVYRELADLLLKEEAPSQENLKAARETIDTLQTLEVENYLRQSCSGLELAEIDRVVDELDSHAAFLYTVTLVDRLELILKLPGSADLAHTQVFVTEEVFTAKVTEFRNSLEDQNITANVDRERKALAQLLYSWLIEPIFSELDEVTTQNLETIVLVADSNLRTVPISALWTGDQYLLEKYATAITPSLQLLGPVKPNIAPLNTFLAGSSSASDGLPTLPYVPQEPESISTIANNSEILLNQKFTLENFSNGLINSSYSVVHLATHGVFSSNLENTYIVAGDDKKIDLDKLGRLLDLRRDRSPNPIDLLFLSACQTAQGDDRAWLGIAGVAVKSGAHSTIASLWFIRDRFSAELAANFYQFWSKNPQLTKAQALRKAQIEALNAAETGQLPVYWAAYLLVGNWL